MSVTVTTPVLGGVITPVSGLMTVLSPEVQTIVEPLAPVVGSVSEPASLIGVSVSKAIEARSAATMPAARDFTATGEEGISVLPAAVVTV